MSDLITRKHFEIVEPVQGAKIKVVGLGGAGGNAVNNMIKGGLNGVEFIVANTDLQALERNLAPTKIQIGSQVTGGLGAGADPDVGRRSAEENLDQLRSCLEGADMVFVTAGLGGGTGTGAAPVVAEMAKSLAALTVAVVTKPFHFEGRRRMKVAEAGFKELKGRVDTLITIPNDRLLALAPKNALFLDMFQKADDVLLQAVRGISDLITVTGHINVDFSDVRTVMSEKGLSLMGTGTAKGDNRAIEAAGRAVSSPLLEDISIAGARGVLMNITAGADVSITEIQDAASLIQKEADEDANVIWGMVIDPEMGEAFSVTVIATGIGPREEMLAPSDMRLIRREAVAELRKRVNEDLDWPTYLREPAPPESETPTVGEARFDPNDHEIPTFLRRSAD